MYVYFETPAYKAQLRVRLVEGDDSSVVTTLPDLSGYQTVNEVRFALAMHFVRAYIENGGDHREGTLQAIEENLDAVGVL